MKNKIKFFDTKSNGIVKKTPDYFDTIDNNFLTKLDDEQFDDLNSLFKNYNLYITMAEDYDFFGYRILTINDQPISQDDLLHVIKNKLEKYKTEIFIQKKRELSEKLKELEKRYKILTNDSINALRNAAYEIPKVIEEFKEVDHNLNFLENNEIQYRSNEFGYFKYIIPDIEPVTADYLLNVILPTKR